MKTVQSVSVDGTIQITFPGGHVIRQKPMALVDQQSEAGTCFSVAVDSVSQFQSDAGKIAKDPGLSNFGKSEKIEPLAAAVIRQLAHCWSAVDVFEVSNKNRLAKLTAVPQLLPGDVVGAANDLEIRNHWFSRSVSERARTMEQINSGPELQRYELALMRSPVALLDHEISFLRSCWDRAARAENPAEAVAVAAGETTVEWARVGLAQCAAVFRSSLEQHAWNDRKMLGIICFDESSSVQAGYRVFGFDAVQVAEFRRQQNARVGSYQPN